MPGLALDAAVNRFSGKRLISQYPGHHRKVNVNVGPSQTLKLGTVLGLAAASVADVQTVTINYTPTGGTFQLVLTVNGNTVTTGYIAYNAAAGGAETGNGLTATPYVSVKGAINAALAAYGASVTTTGGALPGAAVVVTFAGSLASYPVPVMTTISQLSGGTPGTVAVAHTTTGVTGNTYVPYSTALLAAPTVAVAVTQATGTLTPTFIELAYTWSNAVGETSLSPITPVNVTGTDKVVVSSTAFPAGATAMNIYVGMGGNLFLLKTLTAAAAQDITDATIAAGSPQVFPPVRNTTCQAVALLEYDFATDAAGNGTFGLQSGSEWGQVYLSAPCYLNGEFNAADLVGLTADALDQLRGKQLSGTPAFGTTAITSGIVRIP